MLRTVRNRMLHARRQVSEIIRPHRIRLVPIVQNAFSRQNEINLFFAIVVHGLTISVGIERNFRKPGHTSQESIFRIALAEDRLVVTSSRMPSHRSHRSDSEGSGAATWHRLSGLEPGDQTR